MLIFFYFISIISAKGGELFDRIKQESLTEPQARRVMKQLFEALEVNMSNNHNNLTLV